MGRAGLTDVTGVCVKGHRTQVHGEDVTWRQRQIPPSKARRSVTAPSLCDRDPGLVASRPRGHVSVALCHGSPWTLTSSSTAGRLPAGGEHTRVKGKAEPSGRPSRRGLNRWRSGHAPGRRSGTGRGASLTQRGRSGDGLWPHPPELSGRAVYSLCLSHGPTCSRCNYTQDTNGAVTAQGPGGGRARPPGEGADKVTWQCRPEGLETGS